MIGQAGRRTEFKDFYLNFLGSLESYLDSRPPVAPDVIVDLIRELSVYLNSGLDSAAQSPDVNEAARIVLQNSAEPNGEGKAVAHSGGSVGRGATVIPFHHDDSWVNEVKTAALCSERVVAEEPFIHSLAEFEAFQDSKPPWERRSPKEFVPELRDILKTVWDLVPFVEEGILEFRPFLGSTREFREMVDKEAQHHLEAHMEVGEVSDGYPFFVKIKVPLIGFDGWVEYDRKDIWVELGISFREQMVRRMTPHVSGGTQITCMGLKAAIASRGTFWTGSPYYWNLAGAPARDRPDVRSHSFVHSIVNRNLDQVSAAELIAVRKNEVSFLDFRKRIDELGAKLAGGLNEEEFTQEATRHYDYEFKRDLLQIERAYERHPAFKWASLYTGSVALTAVSAHELVTLISAALATFLTFLPPRDPMASSDISDKGAMVFWELGKRP
jgi:hypothetical protein